ncbi:MAG: hypothetical protein IJX70_02345 [Clostridia bacterium]|nr:hypothetical protein [Clostridia bacterium]
MMNLFRSLLAVAITNDITQIVLFGIIGLIGFVLLLSTLVILIVRGKRARAAKRAAKMAESAPLPTEEEPESEPVLEEPELVEPVLDEVEEPISEEVEPISEEEVEEDLVLTEEVCEEPALDEEEEVEAEEPEDEDRLDEEDEDFVPFAQVEEGPLPEAKIMHMPSWMHGDEAVRYAFSFEAKVRCGDVALRDYYAAIRNEFHRYRKVSDRISWGKESFRLGRKLLALMTVRGRTLRLYLALDPEAYPHSVYFQRNVSEIKSYANVPMMVRVRSPRGLRHALALVRILMESVGAKPLAQYEEQDFLADLQPMSLDRLLRAKLVKEIIYREDAYKVALRALLAKDGEVDHSEPVEEEVLPTVEPVEEVVEPTDQEGGILLIRNALANKRAEKEAQETPEWKKNLLSTLTAEGEVDHSEQVDEEEVATAEEVEEVVEPTDQEGGILFIRNALENKRAEAEAARTPGWKKNLLATLAKVGEVDHSEPVEEDVLPTVEPVEEVVEPTDQEGGILLIRNALEKKRAEAETPEEGVEPAPEEPAVDEPIEEAVEEVAEEVAITCDEMDVDFDIDLPVAAEEGAEEAEEVPLLTDDELDIDFDIEPALEEASTVEEASTPTEEELDVDLDIEEPAVEEEVPVEAEEEVPAEVAEEAAPEEAPVPVEDAPCEEVPGEKKYHERKTAPVIGGAPVPEALYSEYPGEEEEEEVEEEEEEEEVRPAIEALGLSEDELALAAMMEEEEDLIVKAEAHRHKKAHRRATEDALRRPLEELMEDEDFAVYSTFEKKLFAASGLLRDQYSELKNKLLSYKKVRDRMSQNAENYRGGGGTVARMTFNGETLRLHLCLDPDEYSQAKYGHYSLAHKSSYAEIPFTLDVVEGLDMDAVDKLIADAMANRYLLYRDAKRVDVDYAAAYVLGTDGKPKNRRE